MINTNLLSKEVEKLFNTKKGYRYENLYGEGYRDIKEVCVHETFELGNDDIPNTLLKLYRDILTDSQIRLLEKLLSGKELCKVEVDVFATMCRRIAQKVTGEENVKCIWLCGNKNDVRGYLMEGEEIDDEDIDEYKLPDNICILSDIGRDGALVAYNFR